MKKTTMRTGINTSILLTDIFSCIQDFCAVLNLENLIKESTFIKDLDGVTRTDHISTSHLECFQHSRGLSDFHKLTTYSSQYVISWTKTKSCEA